MFMFSVSNLFSWYRKKKAEESLSNNHLPPVTSDIPNVSNLDLLITENTGAGAQRLSVSTFVGKRTSISPQQGYIHKKKIISFINRFIMVVLFWNENWSSDRYTALLFTYTFAHFGKKKKKNCLNALKLWKFDQEFSEKYAVCFTY